MGKKFYQKDQSQNRLKPAQYLQKRLARLAPPFLIWTSIYVLVRGAASGTDFSLTWHSWVAFLLMGSAAMQLYYIPLLVYFSCLLLPLVAGVMRKQQSLFFATFVGIAIALSIAQNTGIEGILADGSKIAIFAEYFRYNFPYALLGIFFSYGRFAYLEAPSAQKLKTLVALAFVFLLVSTIWKLSGAIRLLSYSRDVLVFGLCFLFKSQQKGLFQQIANLSFGIYLIHPLFIEGIQKVEKTAGLNLQLLSVTIANFSLGLLLSFAASYVLYRLPKTRFLVA